ncbi:hypothetical protein [Pseudomonas putida]|uniref:hypothetical protein n=1 Tax=Pseudomonas putida TaxID=303 RepID=UPI0037C85D86
MVKIESEYIYIAIALKVISKAKDANKRLIAVFNSFFCFSILRKTKNKAELDISNRQYNSANDSLSKTNNNLCVVVSNGFNSFSNPK